MDLIYRFLIYLFVNAARITLNDDMGSQSGYRNNLKEVHAAIEYASQTPATAEQIDGVVPSIAMYDCTKVENDNTFIDFLLTRLRRVMQQITDLPEKHRARLRFSSD